jgi:hypothetical protein
VTITATDKGNPADAIRTSAGNRSLAGGSAVAPITAGPALAYLLSIGISALIALCR